MIDPSFIRWVNLSLNKYFDTNKGSYFLFIEGQEVDFSQAGAAWAELHLSTGPDINEVSRDSYIIDICVTMMCTVVYNTDDQLLNKITGFFQNLMSQCITVYRYGTDTGDDNSVIGVFQPIKIARTMPWGPAIVDGKMRGQLRVKQQSVEQDFRMTL